MTSAAVRSNPAILPAQYGDLPVLYLYVIAYRSTLIGSSDIFAPPSKKQTNHWSLVFGIGGHASLKVDPSLGDGHRLSLELTLENQPLSDDTARSFKLQPIGLTLNIFLEFIINRRYDQYKFVPSGQGCRHWIARVLVLLVENGFLNEVDGVIDATNVVWDNHGNPVPDNAQSIAEKGTFL